MSEDVQQLEDEKQRGHELQHERAAVITCWLVHNQLKSTVRLRCEREQEGCMRSDESDTHNEKCST